MPTRTSQRQDVIEVEEIKEESLTVCLLGSSPLICNRMSQKARRELLMPRGRKTAAEKAISEKHNLLEEYRASPYVLGDGAPTLIGVMASALKGAIMTAALDIPGVRKAQIGRLVYVVGDYVPIYGVPRLFMSVTRSADMNRTPDVRTRAILPRWAARAEIRYTAPILNETQLRRLIAAAGIVAGIGDWRPEKGKGSYGQFRIVDEADPDFARVVAEGGREAQTGALFGDAPEPYDGETAELLSWYVEERARRGRG
jgi:hypothetical protein